MPDNDDTQDNQLTPPQDVSLNDDPYDFDSILRPNTDGSIAGDAAQNSWYYRPSIGLRDWAARMGSLSQANSSDTTGNASKLGSADEQNVAPGASQNPTKQFNSQSDVKTLQDNYNAQRQANAQFGQKNPLDLNPSSLPVEKLDFTRKYPGQPNTGSANLTDEISLPNGVSLIHNSNVAPPRMDAGTLSLDGKTTLMPGDSTKENQMTSYPFVTQPFGSFGDMESGVEPQLRELLGKYGDPEVKIDKVFPSPVAGKMYDLGSHLSLPSDNIIGRMAAINFGGEENEANYGKNWEANKFDGVAKAGFHIFHDVNAQTGIFMPGEYQPDPDGTPVDFMQKPIGNPQFPEDYTRESSPDWQRAAAQTDPLLHDIGDYNIKLITACRAKGAITVAQMREVAKSLLTDEGSGNVISILVDSAQQDLAPFIRDKSPEDQVQIITDYLRKGPDKFWKDQKTSSLEVLRWRQDPEHVKSPDLTKWTRPNIMHMRQVQQTEKITRPK